MEPTNDDSNVHSRGGTDGTNLGRCKHDNTETPAWSELKTKASKGRKAAPGTDHKATVDRCLHLFIIIITR